MPTERTDDKWHWAIGGSVLLVLTVVVSIVYLHSTQPDRDHGTITTLLLGLTSTTVVALLALLKSIDNGDELRQNTATTTETAQAVSELANGSMDAKIRLAVAEVLAPDMVDPQARPQLAMDQQRRTELDAAATLLRRHLDG